MRWMRILITPLAATVLAACVSTQSANNILASDGKEWIVVYRIDDADRHWNTWPEIVINGTKRGSCAGVYSSIAVEVNPGRHKISLGSSSEITVTVREGETVYVRCILASDKLKVVSAAEAAAAEAEIQRGLQGSTAN